MTSITGFITGLSSGGAEHQLVILTTMLVDKGYDVKLVTFADVPDHYTVSDKVTRLRLSENTNKFFKLISIFLYFIRVQTDVVISFGQRENLLVLFPLIFRKKINVIAGERNFTSGKPSRIELVLLKILYKRANTIVCNSYSQHQHICSMQPSLSSKCRVITNYTDPDLYKFSPVPNNEIIRIGVFCRFEPQKNCLRFLEAIYKVIQQTDKPFIVDWYGNQSFNNDLLKDYFKSVKMRLAQLGLNNNVILHTAVSSVNELLPVFDAIALPSLYEGFSNSISEAICSGRPMLVSNVSDNPILVHDGENGFLFNPNDVNSIASTIIRFLSMSPEQRSLMGEKSREIAQNLFDKNDFINKYISLMR